MPSRPGHSEMSPSGRHVVWIDEVEPSDVATVGAKSASLAALERAARDGVLDGLAVPRGFVVTRQATELMFSAPGVRDRLRTLMEQVHRGERTVHEGGHAARETILSLQVPVGLDEQITTAYARLEASWAAASGAGPMLLAVRSSAVSEDQPDRSFAGQYDTHLGVHGPLQLLDAYRSVLASLFTDRVIDYRLHLGILDPDRLDLDMAVGVQLLVRADLGGCAGVVLTCDPDADPDSTAQLVIEAAPGLGDALVGGVVDPQRYLVTRPAGGRGEPDRHLAEPTRSDAEPVLEASMIDALARAGLTLERRFGHPLDIEWAVDGRTGEMFLLQARPITGARRSSGTADRSAPAPVATHDDSAVAALVTSGLGIGSGRVTAPVCVLADPLEADAFPHGSILVTSFTDPSWMHVMRHASALVTDHGGATSHAAIVARELGLLAVLGCQDATTRLSGVSTATVSCPGDGTGEVRPVRIS